MIWRWQELLSALDITEPVVGPDITGISIDTRSLSPGDLFIALFGDPGPAFRMSAGGSRDGHEFIKAAQSAGAGAILVSRIVDADLPQLKVANTLDALWRLGRFARARMTGDVVAITGSAGKTTARYWLENILSSQAATHASVGSYNNHWGVPLSLARMPESARYGVFEIGMNHQGEIRPLAELVQPQVALVLNVLPAHIGQLGSLEAIRQEKLAIRFGLLGGLQGKGRLIVPAGLEVSDIISNPGTEIITFGLDELADVSATMMEDGGVAARIGGASYQYRLQEGGAHRVMTSLAVLSVVHALRADVAQAINVLVSLGAPEGRGNRHEVNGRIVIDDSYNSNPVSMRYALDTLAAEKRGRRIALLGEMLELGADGESMHREIIEKCDEVDAVVTFGEGFGLFSSGLGDRLWGHVGTVDQFDLESFAGQTRPGDVILVKGSNRVFWMHNFVERLCRSLQDT